MPYIYEPEGYTFEDYAYLPDFWMPSWNVFVEIKPAKPDQEEMKRYIAFAQHAGKSLLIFCGQPVWDGYHIVWCSPAQLENDDLRLGWCKAAECDQLFIENRSWGAQAIAPLTKHDCWKSREWPVLLEDALDAFNAATFARFEFQ